MSDLKLALGRKCWDPGGERTCQQHQVTTKQRLGPGFGFFTTRWSRCDQRYGITEGAQEKPCLGRKAWASPTRRETSEAGGIQYLEPCGVVTSNQNDSTSGREGVEMGRTGWGSPAVVRVACILVFTILAYIRLKY